MLALACIVEQGVTTPAFDQAEERRTMADLTQHVDPAARAFYYHPRSPEIYAPHIDAMMMSLRSGVPTVNGYSGGWPKAWYPLVQIDYYRFMIALPIDTRTPREALAKWLRAKGSTPDRIQTIGEDLDLRPSRP